MATKKPKKLERPDQSKEGREKALADALKAIEKDFGKGAIMKWGDSGLADVEVYSTGSVKLDIALGVGGYPKGRIIEIYGPESSGKTTLALHAVAEVQKQGGKVAYIDAENALDRSYAKALGVDTDDMLLSQPDTGEQGLQIADALAQSGAIDLMVIDSVAALVPQAEIEGEIGDSHVGLQARMMSQALRKLAGTLNRTGTIAIFINQLREKIGIMFGNPETTPGGRALKFYSTIRIDIRKSGSTTKDGDVAIASPTKVKVVKNKVAPPFREAMIDIVYGTGISLTSEVLDLAVEKDIVDKAGAWYAYNGERIGQGKVKVVAFLEEEEHQDMFEEIYDKVRTAYGLNGDQEEADAEETIPVESKKSTKSTKMAKASVDDDEIEILETDLLDDALTDDPIL